MKKYPRWTAMLVVATVLLTSIMAPLEGTAAPGPIKLPDDPRYLLGEPDSPPYSVYPALQITILDYVVRLAVSFAARRCPDRRAAGDGSPKGAGR